jgi:hypothetical protein
MPAAVVSSAAIREKSRRYCWDSPMIFGSLLFSTFLWPATTKAERGSYTRQVQECLAMVADLTGNPDHQAREREAILTVSALVGAISMARAVDDPDLSEQIMTNAAAALKQCILN